MKKYLLLNLFKACLACLFLCCCLPVITWAQQAGISVSGHIKGDDGGALPNASVRLKQNQKIGTTADENGAYSIQVPGPDAILVFTYLGYEPMEIRVGALTQVDPVLTSQQNKLNDLVVIGYGTQKRKDVTGAVGSVNMNELLKAPVKSFDDALGGRLAGVRVTSFDGQPGSSNEIVIRGNNSLTQDNSPLYVIDGFPIEDFDNNDLNPSDIESIDVLKDASATAIYGARGANGVIIITTKRGKVGAPTVTYNAYFGTQHDINRIPVLSPYEFIKLQLELGQSYAAPYLDSTGKTLDDYKNVKGIDWYDMVFRRANQSSHSISISGGNKQTKYSITGSIFDQDGIIINSGFKRYQGRITIDQTVNDKLRVGISANYSNKNEYGLFVNSGGGSTTYMWTVWGSRPVQVDPDLDITELLIDPNVESAPTRTNPFLQVKNQLRKYNSNSLLANGYLEYNLSDAFRIRITGGVNANQGQREAFDNSKTRSASRLPGSVLGVNGTVSNPKNTVLTNENTITYHKIIGKNNITAVLGYTMQTGKVSSFGATASNVPNESLSISGLDEGIPYAITSRISDWGMESFLGRANYNYQNRYILTASIRADGSSKFSRKSRWGYFPSAAFAYRISQEPFMKSLPVINDAKIRIGYGATGNNRVSDFAYLSSMNFINHDYSFDNAPPSVGGVAGVLGNEDLKWETTRQSNFGLDISFFKSRISFTADYYHKVTSDLLLNASMPITTGFTSAFKNVGKVSNSGLELTVNTVNIQTSSFEWTSNFNISFNRNKVLALTQNQEALTSRLNNVATPYYIAKVGYPIAMFYGVIFDGLYQYSDFDRASDGTYILKPGVPSSSVSSNRTGIRPGDMKFKDLNHDGIINNYDFTIIGNPNPDFIGGFSNDFAYKGFDLSLFFQFSYGNQVMDANRVNMEEGSAPYTNQWATYANRWTPDHTNTNIPRVRGSITNYFSTSRVIEDGSFLRFKTVSLGYQLPLSFVNRLTIHAARVYITAQNLYTFTKYSGVDPEVSVRNSALTPGFDYSPYPRTRTYVTGLSVTF